MQKHLMSLALAILFLSPVAALSEEMPKVMAKYVITVIFPKPPAGSFAAQPRTLFRSGTTFLRVEEAPDSVEHIHLLNISHEPDMWGIELNSRTGKHIVDPGPTYNTRVPVFATLENLKSELGKLEIGNELEFFRSHNAGTGSPTTFNKRVARRFDLELDGDHLFLLVDAKTNKPLTIGLIRHGQPEMTLQYDAYEQNLPFDIAKFTPPSDVQCSEVSPLPAKRAPFRSGSL